MMKIYEKSVWRENVESETSLKNIFMRVMEASISKRDDFEIEEFFSFVPSSFKCSVFLYVIEFKYKFIINVFEFQY